MSARLADIVVDVCLFLETADDEAVHPDAAVALLEQIAHALLLASPEDRATFVRRVEERRQRADTDGDGSVLAALPEHLGLR